MRPSNAVIVVIGQLRKVLALAERPTSLDEAELLEVKLLEVMMRAMAARGHVPMTSDQARELERGVRRLGELGRAHGLGDPSLEALMRDARRSPSALKN